MAPARVRVRPVLALGTASVSAAALLAVGVALWLLVKHWGWLNDGASPGETIRNIGLITAAVIALPLAIWRSIVATRQAVATQRQALTAQQGLLNERYQKATEMLGNDVLSVRLGGIYALEHLAREHPDQYHLQIVKLLCAFVRNPPREGGSETTPSEGKGRKLREDVQAAIAALAARDETGLEIERQAAQDHPVGVDPLREQKFMRVLDLSETDLRRETLTGAPNLSGANLEGADLSGANLKNADLSNARLVSANLNLAILREPNLSRANLKEANLSRAVLSGGNLLETVLYYTNLSEALLSCVAGLTQTQLNMACADPDKPPRLNELVVDSQTGKPPVWQGKPCDSKA